MATQFMNVKFTGIRPLLLNNPQTVDRFNPYAKAMKKINDKKNRRTDDDYIELKNIEMRAKSYWDDEIGIYVPSTWLTAAIAGASFKTTKVSKASIRSAVFPQNEKLPLNYQNMSKVKTLDDIVMNEEFRYTVPVKQGQVKVMKSTPIFHKWSFESDMEFDDAIIDADSLETILIHVAKYGGFGDFRPTFGRAEAEITYE